VHSQLYPFARELFATRQLDWRASIVRGLFLPAVYVPVFTDHYLSDIPVAMRIAISEEITGRTAVDGVCTGSPAKFPLLFDNRAVAQALLFVDSGDEATSILVAYLGDDNMVNEPFVPVGLNYYIYPNAAEGGFFRL
jgi:hypothetical protein